MTYDHREGSGILFPNRDKTGDNHPDYKGDGMFNGQRVELAAWKKQGKKGEFLSVQIKPARERQAPTQDRSVNTAPPSKRNDAEDEIPF